MPLVSSVFPVIGAIVLASASPAEVPLCPNVSPPLIAVDVGSLEPVIRHDLTKNKMSQFVSDTTLPTQMQELSHLEVGGMMQGDIHVRYDVVTGTIPGNTAETVHLNCVRYQTIKITLELAPTIFIASDYAPESCWYHEILEHEQSHIDMDRVVVEKYRQRMADGLALAFSEPGDSVQGPVRSKKEIAALKKSMGDQIVQMTDGLIADMKRERQSIQQSVDSTEGYAFIMNSCYQGDNVLTVSR